MSDFNILKFLNGDFGLSNGVLGIKITPLVIAYLILVIGCFVFKFKKQFFIFSNPFWKNYTNVKSSIKELESFYNLLSQASNSDELKNETDKYFREYNHDNSSKSLIHTNLEHAWKEFSEGIHKYRDQFMNVYPEFRSEVKFLII
jgi:hypothetical protein